MNLSSSSVNEVISKLQLLKQELNQSNNGVVEDLSNLAKEQIENNYAASPYTDGNDDVEVFKVKTDKGIKVGAKGSQVLYREFGTGTEGLNSPHPMKNEFSLNAYNTGRKIKVNSKNGELYWIYKDKSGKPVYTQGIPAGKEVYNAAVILKGKKYSIIKKRVGEALSKL